MFENPRASGFCSLTVSLRTPNLSIPYSRRRLPTPTPLEESETNSISSVQSFTPMNPIGSPSEPRATTRSGTPLSAVGTYRSICNMSSPVRKSCVARTELFHTTHKSEISVKSRISTTSICTASPYKKMGREELSLTPHACLIRSRSSTSGAERSRVQQLCQRPRRWRRPRARRWRGL